MKIIFLDMDGVVNSGKWLDSSSKRKYKKAKGKLKKESGYSAMINPDSVLILNQIIKETNAKVVISSSWRIIRTHDEIAKMLKEKGFIGEVIGSTPALIRLGMRRGDEIRAWLDSMSEDIDNYVILDDCSDMCELKKNLVQTTWAIGITTEHALAAIALLNNKVK